MVRVCGGGVGRRGARRGQSVAGHAGQLHIITPLGLRETLSLRDKCLPLGLFRVHEVHFLFSFY